MTTIAENSNRDIFTDANHNLALVVGIDEVAQNCKAAMEVVLKECVLDLQHGMPYDETMWSTYLPRQFEAAGRKTLLAVGGVTGVLSFAVQRSGDVASYRASIQTSRGAITVQGVIPNV
jgi:hypothetical protein